MRTAYSVYIHTCPDGQKYVGVASRSPEYRWQNGLGYVGQWFGCAVDKWGWENITHEIVAEGLDRSEAEAKEAELINSLHTWCPGVGYNDMLGVNKGKGTPLRDTTTHKVYPSIRHACSDVGRSVYWVKKRFQVCNAQNISQQDIYMPV